MYGNSIIVANALRNLASEIHSRSGREVRAKYARRWSEALSCLADDLEGCIPGEWFGGDQGEPDGACDLIDRD